MLHMIQPRAFPVRLAGFLLFCISAACAPTGGKHLFVTGLVTKHVEAVPGVEQRVAGYAGVTPTCDTEAPPPVLVFDPPTHGKVTIRPDAILITHFPPEVLNCPVRLYEGEGVYYESDPDYVGTDQFRFTVTLRGRERESQTQTVIVTIR